MTEFKKINRKIRPAVEKLIEEADEIAKASSANYIDRTDEVFGDDEEAGFNDSSDRSLVAKTK